MLYTSALTLGAFHAFEPGHGKTLIAAYMIGTKGRAQDGILLGAIVTFTHTFSVILLGLAASLLAHSYSDEQLHNWLGLVSAALILGVGLWMLRQRLSGSGSHRHLHLFGKDTIHHHDHSHDHHHHHDAPAPSHSHDTTPRRKQATPSERTDTALNKWNLLLLGISGGIVPCPAAIAVLLAAIAAGKIAHGLSVTVFFSLGLGLVMMSIGVVLSQAGRLTAKISENQDLSRRMGIASSFIIVFIGSYTLFTSVKNIWF